MYTARKVGLSILVIGPALLLAACGGSSSSGAAAFAGTYAVDGTASASDGTSASRALQSVVEVEDSGNVTVDPGTVNAFSGTISGNDISAVVAAPRLDSPGLGISCTGAVRVTAAAFNTGIRDGSISSTNLVCNGAAMELGGEFSGPEVASTGFPGGRDAPPLLGALRGAIQAAL